VAQVLLKPEKFVRSPYFYYRLQAIRNYAVVILSNVIMFLPNLVKTDELGKNLRRVTESIVISLACFNFQVRNADYK
jgi:hypothetical protein